MVPDWIAERVRAEEWEAVGGGYTRAPKWRARLYDGTSVFVKAAADDELVLRPLRRELLVYESVRGAFLPAVRDAYAGPDGALLVLEDLSEGRWPPPYPDQLEPLFAALEAVAAAPPPSQLLRLEHQEESPWGPVARDPQPLLALGLCSADWLSAALPGLDHAATRVPLEGNSLVHHDVWADNMCFTERGAVLVDWAEARIGNPAIDLAFALLSLRVGGAVAPPVEDEAGLAAFVTGVVAREASRPPPAWERPGSTLREDQRGDLKVALPWAAEQLGLPPPG